MALTKITYGEIRALIGEVNQIWASNKEMPGKVFKILQDTGKQINPFSNKIEEKLIELRKQCVNINATDGTFKTVEGIRGGQKVQVYDFIDEESKQIYDEEVKKLFATVVSVPIIKLNLNDIANVVLNQQFSNFATFFKIMIYESE